MIYDRLENICKYKNTTKWFPYLMDFLKETTIEELPIGRTEIHGNHVFLNLMEVDTKEEESVYFEIHKKYLDVQICLEGEERILIGTGESVVVQEFASSIDFGTVDCNTYVNCIMNPGYFIICMNEEPHKPTIEFNGSSKVKKCVIKVEVDDYE